MQLDAALKPTLTKMQRILKDSPVMINSHDALRLMLIQTALDDVETQRDALSVVFGRSHARTIASWLQTLSLSFALDAEEFRALILSTVRYQSSNPGVVDQKLDVTGLLSEEEEMLKDSLRLWLQTDEGKTHWRSQTFKNAILLSVHIGDTSTFCSSVLKNVLASDARRLDECKTTVDESMQDDDLLLRLIDQIANDCSEYLAWLCS